MQVDRRIRKPRDVNYAERSYGGRRLWRRRRGRAGVALAESAARAPPQKRRHSPRHRGRRGILRHVGIIAVCRDEHVVNECLLIARTFRFLRTARSEAAEKAPGASEASIVTEFPHSWDWNWDGRDGEKRGKATRHILLARHGRYNIDAEEPQLQILDLLGVVQVRICLFVCEGSVLTISLGIAAGRAGGQAAAGRHQGGHTGLKVPIHVYF